MLKNGRKNRNKENREWGNSEKEYNKVQFPMTPEEIKEAKRASWLNNKR